MSVFGSLFNSSEPEPSEDRQEDVQSPYYQPEESGQPAENPDEEAARSDYIEEKEETESDPIPDEPPEWAKNLPDPRDYK